MQPIIHLKPNKDRTVLQYHPWIFSGAVHRIDGDPLSGSTVEIRSSKDEFLAWAAYSPQSKIIARIWSWDQAEKIDTGFFTKKLTSALSIRQRLISKQVTDSFRFVYAESDGLPGIIVDHYADVLVLQLLSAGAEYWKDTLVEALRMVTKNNNIFERSDVDVRNLEGLPERTGWLSGTTLPQETIIHEHGIAYKIDFQHGQKTGFYLDQRLNRKIVGELSNGLRVLNCFCYTGGFSLNALAGGASQVISIDSSGPALAQAKVNQSLNPDLKGDAQWLEGDVFFELRKMRDRNEHFDLIVLDPPKFASSAAQVEKASRAYKDINLLAFKLLNPGGTLATFSCSGGITADLFQKIVSGAARDALVNARIVKVLTQDVDHPVGLHFPEGAYLKGLICVKD